MNRDALQSYVSERLTLSGADSPRVEQILALLREEHVRIVGEYELLKTLGSISFTDGTATATLPSDWYATLSLRNGATELQAITPERFIEYAADSDGDAATTGPWCFFQSGPLEITLHPTPIEDSTASILYVNTPEAMDETSDLPEGLPEGHHQVLAESVVKRIALMDDAVNLARESERILAEMDRNLRRHIARRTRHPVRAIRPLGYAPR